MKSTLVRLACTRCLCFKKRVGISPEIDLQQTGMVKLSDSFDTESTIDEFGSIILECMPANCIRIFEMRRVSAKFWPLLLIEDQ